MSSADERDSATLLLPLLQELSALSPDSAVWKNVDSGLSGSGDVDFVAPKRSWPAAETLFRSWARGCELGPVIVCRHMPDTMFLIAVDRARNDFIQLDVRSRMTFRGSTVFVPSDLGSCFELDERGFRRLRPGAEGLLKLVISGIAPGGRPRERAIVKEDVVQLLSGDSQGLIAGAALCAPVGKAVRSGAQALVEGGWNRRAMATVEAWFVVKGVTEPRTAWRRVRAKQAKERCELIQTSIKSSRRIPGNVNDWVTRVGQDHTTFAATSVLGKRHPNKSRKEQPGVVLSVVGPDGVGKSTLIDGLLAERLSTYPIMRIRNVGMLPRRTAPGTPVTEPHKDPVYPTILSLAKLAYVFIDYLGGWFLRLRPFIRKGGWVVLERGWWDMAVDPARYRLKVPVRLMFVLGKILPKPDILFILEAPASTVRERKQELTLEELARQMRVWRNHLPSQQNRLFLNASLPVSEVLAIAKHSLDHLREPNNAPINLPSSGNTRWVLPRTPRSIAEAGLHIYHPVTVRGLVGWHLARAAASMGLFALMPRGDTPDRMVMERVSPHVPEGGTLAVARTNHPGRFVALILDSEGNSVAVAKLASDELGRSKLRGEAAHIDLFSDRLSLPLNTPRIVDFEDGLLLMEAVEWQSRLRPWRLPKDVAFALGRFYAGCREDGSTNSGSTHGDFAPWNLLKSKTGWVLLDWEEARIDGEPFWDVFHFLVQGHALLRRPTASSLLSGIDGGGWVGEGIRAYASSAGLTPEEASTWFHFYLEHSQRGLNPQTDDGRAGLNARRALIEDLRS
jgi:thymidylate kinase